MPLLEGKDVIGQAQTGTGKTAAFGIPMIQRSKPRNPRRPRLDFSSNPRVSCTSRRKPYSSRKYPRIKVLAVYGGESINKQIHALSNGVQIVVGTPGRIIDLMERRVLNLGSVRMVTLDEADQDARTWAL